MFNGGGANLVDGLEQLRQLNVNVEALTQALSDRLVTGAIPVEVVQPPAHSEWQPSFIARISQSAAGFTNIATAMQGLHYVKLLGAVLTADAAGTIEFYAGAGKDAGTTGVDRSLTGLLPVAQNSGFVLPVTPVEDPWLWTEPGQTLSFNSVTSKISGWCVWCNSPDLR